MLSNKLTIVALCLFLFSCALYVQSFQAEFTNWDDPVHVTENPDVLTLNLHTIQSIFSRTVNKSYQPLTHLSFAIEHYFFGFNPFVFHLTNVFLHGIVVVMVFFLAMRLNLSARMALLAALIFAVHPMHVESVAWITERKDVLYSVFYLAAIFQYLNYRNKGCQKFYYYALILAVLSMFAKSMAFSLPMVLLVVDWFLGRKDYVKAILEKVPFVLVIVPIALVTFFENTYFFVWDKNLFDGFLMMVWSYTFYLIKFFYPAVLVPIYDLPDPVSLSNPPYAIAVIVFVLIVVTLVRFKNSRLFVFALLFFTVSICVLLRVEKLFYIKTLVSDRFMYLPSVGICMWLGYMIVNVWESLRRNRGIQIVFLTAIFFYGLLLSIKTINQIKIWNDSIALWNYVIVNTNDRHFAYGNRGRAYMADKNYDMAFKDFQKAIEINPLDAKTFFSRGTLYFERGEYDLALKDMDHAIELDAAHGAAQLKKSLILEANANEDAALRNLDALIHDDPAACNYFARSRIYRKQGKLELALADLNRALSIDPNYTEVYIDRGALLTTLGREDGALKDFNRAVSLDKNNFEAFFNRGLIYLNKRQFQQALKDFNTAIRINPRISESYSSRGLVYKNLKMMDEALRDYSRAIELNSNNAVAYVNRGIIHSMYDQLELSLKDYNRALSVNPGFFEGYVNRASLFMRMQRMEEALADVNRALQINPNVSMVHLLQSEILKSLNKNESHHEKNN